MEDRSKWPVVVLRGRKALEEFDPDAEVRALTPEQRIAMAWPLTAQAYSFGGFDLSQPDLSRLVEGVSRRKSRVPRSGRVCRDSPRSSSRDR